MKPGTRRLNRRSLALGAIVCLTIPLGYWLRLRAPIEPQWRDRSGGALYVLLWTMLLAACRPGMRPTLAVAWVLGVTCVLEFLQLWHPVWLEAIRATFPGRVLLGTTFDWFDFPNYFAGAALSWLLLRLLGQHRTDRCSN